MHAAHVVGAPLPPPLLSDRGASHIHRTSVHSAGAGDTNKKVGGGSGGSQGLLNIVKDGGIVRKTTMDMGGGIS